MSRILNKRFSTISILRISDENGILPETKGMILKIEKAPIINDNQYMSLTKNGFVGSFNDWDGAIGIEGCGLGSIQVFSPIN